MAKRFGGEFSPSGQRDGDTPRETVTAERLEVASFKGRKPLRHGAKLNILFILPLLILPTIAFQPVTAFVTDLLGGAALLLSAWLTRDGVRAEDAFNERNVARKPAIPRKIFGSVTTGIGVGLLIFGGQWALLPAILVGAVAAGLHLFSFGVDPLKDKGLEGMDKHQTDRIARKIDEAEAMLDEMTATAKRARDRRVNEAVAGFAETARQMFRQVEADPRDLTQARRYLGVYLQGARDATRQFIELYERDQPFQVRSDYLSFLEDLETNFAKRRTAMLTDDRTNFDVEIEVLRDRLNRENLHIEG